MPSAQLSLLAAAAACCLSLAHADDELNAAPVDSLLSVGYCAVNSDCRWSGDTDAVCSLSTKICVCTTHRGSLCQVGPSGVAPGATTPMNIVATLRDVACDRAQLDALLALIDERVIAAGLPSPSSLGVCGSVTLVVQVDAPTLTLDTSVGNATAGLREAVVLLSNFTQVQSTDDFVTQAYVSQAATGFSPCDGFAVNTIIAYDERCVVLECMVGYNVTRTSVAGKDKMECVLPDTTAPRSFGDDDLSGGAITAIVLGVLFLVVLIAAAVYLLLTKQDDLGGATNEPYETKEDNIRV